MYYKYDYFLDDNPDVIKRVKKGLVEGRLQEARNSIMQLISKRFPILEQLALSQVERISVLSELNQLFTQLLDATSEAEVCKLLNLPVE
jgi:uncharacterized coiled-coil DUF342 family protein